MDVSGALPKTGLKKEAESLTYAKVLFDPYYRYCTFVICLLAFLCQATGINAINMYSQTIFEKIQEESSGGISPRMGNVLLMITQFVANLFVPFVGKLAGIKTIFVYGMFVMGVLLFLIGLFAMLNKNNLVVLTMMVDLAVFQLTLGALTWVYIGQVAEEKAASLAVFGIWFWTFVLALTTDSLFDSLGNAGTFWLFSGMTLMGAILFIITIRETKGLTDEDIKVLFVPTELKK